MVIYALFSFVALCAALVAALVSSMKRASLALWIAGLSMGAVYLTLGAETVAIIQWVVSTLVAISLFFFSVMFGEYEGPAQKPRKALGLLVPGALGLAFAAVAFLGSGTITLEMLAIPKQGSDLAALGAMITDHHLLSLEVLALTLLLVMVGGGAVARPDSEGKDKESDLC